MSISTAATAGSTEAERRPFASPRPGAGGRARVHRRLGTRPGGPGGERPQTGEVRCVGTQHHRRLAISNPAVDDYIAESDQWPAEIAALRPILLDCGLAEELKWRKPCYTHEGANIAIVQEMKDFLALMFFKGALLDDPDGALEDQGPNSRSAKRLTFRSVDEVTRSAPTVAALVERAIAVEKAGLEIDPPADIDYVEELRTRLDTDPEFRAAFEGLTPGRRREYNLHFADAKKSETRTARIERYTDRILAGKGMRDR